MIAPFNVNELSRWEIFTIFKENDESHLWPVRDRFNVTIRAIRRLQKFEEEGGIVNDGLELWLWLENEISNIVNDPKL